MGSRSLASGKLCYEFQASMCSLWIFLVAVAKLMDSRVADLNGLIPLHPDHVHSDGCKLHKRVRFIRINMKGRERIENDPDPIWNVGRIEDKIIYVFCERSLF